jgi:hypothetical protein
MQGKRLKSPIFRVRATAPAVLWRRTEAALSQRGILFSTSNIKNKATNLSKERKQYHRAERLLSLCTTPSPLVRGGVEQKD